MLRAHAEAEQPRGDTAQQRHSVHRAQEQRRRHLHTALQRRLRALRLAFRSMRIKKRGDPQASDASPLPEGPATIRPEPFPGIEGNIGPARFDSKAAEASSRHAGAPEDAAIADAVRRQMDDAEASKLDPDSADPVAALDEETAALMEDVKAAEAGGEQVDRAEMEAADTLAAEAEETATALDAAASCIARRGV